MNRRRGAGAWLGRAVAAALCAAGMERAAADGGAENEAAEAVAWIARDAAEQGDAGAQVEYGDRLYAGIGVPRNVAAALEWWSRAALQGHADAMVRVADCLARGDGVEKDEARAAALYTRAANRNHTGAMVRLGVALAKGTGVAKDPAAADRWLAKAAAMDHPEAQYLIAWKLENDDGTPEAMRRAAALYRRSADKGYAPAMMSLGVCHAEGSGVERDLQEAYAWSLLAVRMGEARAEENVRRLAAGLNPFKRIGGRRRADAIARDLGLP